MTNEEIDSFKKTLEEKKKDDDEKFTTLINHLQKLINNENDVEGKLYPTIIQLIVKELQDLSHGVAGSYEVMSGLVDDRNKIVNWINNEEKEKESLLGMLDIIESKLDEFDKFIENNKDRLKNVEKIESTHKDVIDFRNQLAEYANKIKEQEKPNFDEKRDFPFIG